MAVDVGRSVGAHFIGISLAGLAIGVIGCWKFVSNGIGNPCSHSIETVASMYNDVKVALLGQTQQVAVCSLHTVL